MKKLLSTILFLLPTLALAIDKPIPCTGNSCKLLFETTGSGVAKISSVSVGVTSDWHCLASFNGNVTVSRDLANTSNNGWNTFSITYLIN